MTKVTIDDLRQALRDRFITVINDLPLSQPLQASAAIALREVQTNVKDILEEK